jgi:hypothetical protein
VRTTSHVSDRARAIFLFLLSATLGCGSEASAPEPPTRETTTPPSAAPTAAAPTPAAPPPAAPTAAAPTPAQPSGSDDAALGRANAAATALASTLRARLLAAMAEGGPAAAAQVCSDAAQGMATDVARAHDARVGRSSLRTRSPANVAPPWVEEWLRTQGERPAAGAEGFARIEDGHARVLRPIAVEGPCVACHGDPDAIAPEVTAILRDRYPTDRATGYAIGDLRGALWAEVDLR